MIFGVPLFSETSKCRGFQSVFQHETPKMKFIPGYTTSPVPAWSTPPRLAEGGGMWGRHFFGTWFFHVFFLGGRFDMMIILNTSKVMESIYIYYWPIRYHIQPRTSWFRITRGQPFYPGIRQEQFCFSWGSAFKVVNRLTTNLNWVVATSCLHTM